MLNELGFRPRFGFNLHACPWMTQRKQVRFPISKKRRIQKKWRKRPQNWKTVPKNEVIQSGFDLYAHPIVIERLKRKLKEV